MEMNTFPLSCTEALWFSPAVILDLGLPPSEGRRPLCSSRQVHTLPSLCPGAKTNALTCIYMPLMTEIMMTKRRKTLKKYELFCSIIFWCSTAPGRVEYPPPPREAGKCIPLWCPLLTSPASSHLPEEHCSYPLQPRWDF